MTEFKIGSYTITNKEIYEVLKQENVSDGVLKGFDVNGDKVISEDELQELLCSDEDESNKTDTTVDISEQIQQQLE